MSHTVVIAGRELAEKRFVFYAALAFAGVATLMGLVPFHAQPRDVVTLASLILAATLALGVATILGASIVGREISAGRMSFYFARPLSAAAIWFGKLAASAVLVAASFFVALVPALVAGKGNLTRVWSADFGQVTVLIGISAVVLFFLAHAISTMVRSRSALIGADFAAVVLGLWLLRLMARPLLDAQAARAAAALLTGLSVALVVVLIGAGAWQLIDGRTDRRRSHAAFSAALWSGVAVALLLAGAFVGWIVSAAPADLDGFAAVQKARRGDWVLVSGAARHRLDYKPVFLLNAQSGAWQRIGPAFWDVAFSGDGSKLLELRPLFSRSAIAEVVVREAASGRTTESGITLSLAGTRLAASDDVSRLAVLDRGILTVYDVAARRAMASARMEGDAPWMFFVSPALLRLYVADGEQIKAFEFDAAHRALRQSGAMVTPHAYTMRANADGSRLITVEAGALAIRDGRTLQPLGSIPFTPGARTVRGAFLGDGRVVVTESNGGRATLRVGSRAIDLGPGTPWTVSDLGAGKVAVSVWNATTGERRWSCIAVDVDRGVVLRREDNATIAPRVMAMPDDPRAATASPDVLLVRGKTLLRWNALTGETKVLLSS